MRMEFVVSESEALGSEQFEHSMQRTVMGEEYVSEDNRRRKEWDEDEKRTGIDDKVVGTFGGILAYASEKETCSSVFITDNGDKISAFS